MKYHVFDEKERFSEFAGGAISRWAANVVRNDEDTHIVCVAADDSWGFPTERIRLVPSLSRYLRLRARRFYPVWLNGLILRNLYHGEFPKLEPGDIVWIHGQPDIALALAPWVREAGAKLVLHLHGSLFVTSPARTMANVAKTCDKLVFCSAFLENEARNKFPWLSKTALLYNGADDSLFYPPNGSSPAKSSAPVVLVASRLVPEKGVHVLMEAMRILEGRSVAVTAKVLGSSFFGGSPPSAYVENLHRIAPANVTFAGYCAGKALAEEFRLADIFCLPATYNDPFPLAILEAMASGLPVVSTKRGGIPEAFVEGGGVLVAPSSARELADAIQNLAFDPDLRARLAHDGYQSFKKNFTWRSVYERYHEIAASL
jgi:spore coat protein SA